MKILVPIENDMIYQHFGHTPALRLYDVEGNTVLHTKDYVPNGQGHVSDSGRARCKCCDCRGIWLTSATNSILQWHSNIWWR